MSSEIPEVPAGQEKPRRKRRKPFSIGGEQISPGERTWVELKAWRLFTHTDVVIPVHVVHGKREGPVLFVCAAIHGDEINGVEVIRRLLKMRLLDKLRGTLLAVPVVNVHGFLAHSRYLPDRRDLNRCFPGSRRGSLGARLAHLFMEQIVSPADYGIDLHTGSNHRANLPQVRANLDDEETARLAVAFGAPVLIHAKLRDNSLREAGTEVGTPVLLYEGGEALRFEESVTRGALRGVLNVMRELKMLRPSKVPARGEPVLARSSDWVRSPESGMLLGRAELGQPVKQGDLLAVVTDPLGQTEHEVRSRWDGVLVGMRRLPLVNEGDALYHIAKHDEPESVTQTLEQFEADLDLLPLPPHQVDPEPELA